MCGNILLAVKTNRYAPVAQLDRVSDYESEGREFESLPARQIKRIPNRVSVLFIGMRAGRDSKTSVPSFKR